MLSVASSRNREKNLTGALEHQRLIYSPGYRKDRLFAGLSGFNFASYNLKSKSSGKLTYRDGKDIGVSYKADFCKSLDEDLTITDKNFEFANN